MNVHYLGIVLVMSYVERAVFRNVLSRNFLNADNTLARCLIDIAELFCYGIFVVDDNIIAVKDRKRLVADKALGAHNCVAESLCLLLADIIHIGNIGTGENILIKLFLARIA